MEDRQVKAYIINVAEAAAQYRSYMLPESRDRKIGPKELVNPPLDMGRLAEFYNESTWHRNAVRVRARDVLGHHWGLEGIDPSGNGQNGSTTAQDELEEFFRDGAVEAFTKVSTVQGPIPLYSTLSEVMERVLIDLDTVGNGYLAVIREDRAGGVPQWYAHVQAPKIRVHRDRVRFRWQDGRRTQHWFKRFGLEADVHVKTGEVDALGSLAVTDRAPELIPFQTYTPTDDYYGLPNVTPAIGGMVMDMLARDYNIRFFDNHAIPQYAVILEGVEGELSDQTTTAIKEFFATAKGNPHQTLVLSSPSSLTGEGNTSIRFERLAVEVKEGHFRLLREDSRNEVLAANAVPGYRLGLAITGQLGGSNIQEADEIYKAEELDPRRELVEGRINRLIIRQGFGIDDWELRFSGLDTSDLAREAETWVKLVSTGFATLNEGREALGMQRIEDRPELDEFYFTGRVLGDLVTGDEFDLFREREAVITAMFARRDSRNGHPR